MTRKIYVVRDGKVVNVTAERAERSYETDLPAVRVSNPEHICHTFNDPEIPHLVTSGPFKGKRGFRTTKEIKTFEGVMKRRGLDWKFNP